MGTLSATGELVMTGRASMSLEHRGRRCSTMLCPGQEHAPSRAVRSSEGPTTIDLYVFAHDVVARTLFSSFHYEESSMHMHKTLVRRTPSAQMAGLAGPDERKFIEQRRQAHGPTATAVSQPDSQGKFGVAIRCGSSAGPLTRLTSL